jgi:hypothetical protein
VKSGGVNGGAGKQKQDERADFQRAVSASGEDGNPLYDEATEEVPCAAD